MDWRALSVPALLDDLLRALQRVLSAQDARDGAERVLDRLLRDHPELDNRGRRAVAESVYGVSLWRRRLAALLPTPAPSPPEYLFGFLCELGGVHSELAAKMCGLATAPSLREIADDASLGIACSFPDWLVEHFVGYFSERRGKHVAKHFVERFRDEKPRAEIRAFLDALNLPAPIFLRANGLKVAERGALVERLRREEDVLAQPAALASMGLRVDQRFNILGSAAFREGAFEVQDEGSQLVGLHLKAAPGERVLDFCAGAGGKSLLLADAVGNRGHVVSYDIDRARLGRLRTRALHAGALNIRIAIDEPPGEFDRVLVDAPCSELGTLRRGPDRRHWMRPDVLTQWTPVQSEVLERAASHVKPGGILVYATCTLNHRENEDVVNTFLERHAGRFQRVEEDQTWLPHVHRTDGFFASRLERAS